MKKLIKKSTAVILAFALTVCSDTGLVLAFEGDGNTEPETAVETQIDEPVVNETENPDDNVPGLLPGSDEGEDNGSEDAGTNEGEIGVDEATDGLEEGVKEPEPEQEQQEEETSEMEVPEGFVFTPGYVRPENYRAPEEYVNTRKSLRSGPSESQYINGDGILDEIGLRSQSPHGTCWAMSSIGLAEFSLYKQNIKSDPDLSEMHLAYFAHNSVEDPLGGTEGDQSVTYDKQRFLNAGSNYDVAANTFASWIGAADETTVPYSKGSSIKQGTPLDTSLAFLDSAHLVDSYNINIKSNPNEVKDFVKRNGAVGISFYADDPINGGTSDAIYNPDTNSYYCPSPMQANHAVMIVGWDDNYSRENFAIDPESDGAWLVRNSWTTGTYDNRKTYYGYFWMSYKDASIDDEAVAFVFDTADNYEHNYQYDGGVLDSYMGY